MTKEQVFKELEEYIITSISTEKSKHININVAKRVIGELIASYENQTEIRNLKVKIEKLEIKFSEVLDYATGSRISNSGADMNAIERCIDDVINSAVDDYAELVGE